MQKQPFSPEHTYIHLDSDGVATSVPGGAEFWALTPDQIKGFGKGWLISEYQFDADWPTWEMHPNADEYVYLLSGEIALHLDEPGGLRVVSISGNGAVVVPRGIWHTAKVKRPCRMLHVTMGAGTEIRAVVDPAKTVNAQPT